MSSSYFGTSLPFLYWLSEEDPFTLNEKEGGGRRGESFLCARRLNSTLLNCALLPLKEGENQTNELGSEVKAFKLTK